MVLDSNDIKELKIESVVGERIDDAVCNIKENFLTGAIQKARDSKKVEELVDEEEIQKRMTSDINKIYSDKIINFAKDIPNNIVGKVNNGTINYFKKKDSTGSDKVQIEYLPISNDNLEVADLTPLFDNIPKGEINAGDRFYIINGRPVSAWGLYFGPNSIRSPEDYAKNLDLIWNVPYIFASFELKAEMGLGASFKVSDGKNTQDSEEEKWVGWLLNERLNINNEFRKKCSFHEDSYGNYYIHVHRDNTGIPDKLTILQPERMKVYIDPLTTKILFYVYLPPIMSGSLLMTGVGNSNVNKGIIVGNINSSGIPNSMIPKPIVIAVNDIIHITDHKYTEYPFGFSGVRPILDVAQTRFDCNIMVPYYFKKYIKPTIHWRYDYLNNSSYTQANNKGNTKIKTQLGKMETKIESMEPGSDLLTTMNWIGTVIQANQGQSEIYSMINDCDNQIFSCLRVPETYFKAKGTTDKTATNEDKTFLGSLKQKQVKFANGIFDKVIKPSINIKFGNEKYKKEKLDKQVKAAAKFQSIPLEAYDNFYEMNYPKMEFEDITKTDITQEIANVTAMLNNELITHERAAQRLGEKYDADLKKFQDIKMKTEIEQMENPMGPEGEMPDGKKKPDTETDSNDVYTELKGQYDMTKQSKTSELANPQGKFKRADNKVSNSKGDKVDRVKKPKKEVETADNFLMINGEKIEIINGDE